MDWRTRPAGDTFDDTAKKDRSWLWMGLAVLALIILIVAVKACSVLPMMTAGPPPEQHATVTSMKAAYQEWRTNLEAVGSVHPVRGADLSTELPGVVDSIKFASGQDVAEGDLIVQLRVEADQATLRAQEAQYQLAKTNFERAKSQAAVKMISKADYDAAFANLNSARAQYEAQKAIVDKKSVRAPFAGRLGIINVNVGQYVNAGDRIVTLQTLDPIYLDFTLPQQALAQVAAGQAVRATTDAFPGMTFDGTIEAIDPKVDVQTRNVSVRATMKNPERKLFPGMFANVTIDVGAPQRYLTLPQTAVTFNPYGETVFVIVPRGQENQPDPNAPPEARQQAAANAPAKDEKAKAAPAPDNVRVARQIFVQVGPKRGDQIAILKGVNEGDEVVTSGQLKLRNGMPVDVDNSVQPSFDPNPAPQEQ